MPFPIGCAPRTGATRPFRTQIGQSGRLGGPPALSYKMKYEEKKNAEIFPVFRVQ